MGKEGIKIQVPAPVSVMIGLVHTDRSFQTETVCVGQAQFRTWYCILCYSGYHLLGRLASLNPSIAKKKKFRAQVLCLAPLARSN